MEHQPAPSLAILKWAAVAFCAVTILITVVFFGWWAMKDRLVFGDDRFDTVRWMAPASTQASPCQRGDMVLDVRQRLLKPGMLKSEVTMLLGRPAWEESDQIEYDLGVCLWVVHGLRLYFDQQDRLMHTAIIQH
jgi:outer membrane protein assembly factor BamE (lipoprotein component of BamABCDE complex)